VVGGWRVVLKVILVLGFGPGQAKNYKNSPCIPLNQTCVPNLMILKMSDQVAICEYVEAKQVSLRNNSQKVC
jgi:hypothetical protein